MFRTIFSKLVAIFISILIIGFSITGVMLYYFLGDFASDEKAGALGQAADDIADFLDLYIENEGNPIAKVYLSLILDNYSVNTRSLIFIVNKDGYVVSSGPATGRMPGEIMKYFLNESGNYKLPDLKRHNRLMLSQQTDRQIGDFNGLFKDTGYLWLTVEKPFKYDYSGVDITGVIYMNTPMPEILKVRYSVFKFFLISVLVSILISIVLVYIFSLKISKPLKQINNAAKVIAGGEFRKKLHIESQDEIGELARSFNQMVAALQNLEEMRRGFIANVSHELRTPMTLIRGFVEGILDGTIPPEKHSDYLAIVRDETDRLNRLVNDLLDLAKMEAGEATLSFSEFDINELVRRCIIKLEKLIVNKGIQVEANFEEEETMVNADSDAIERVLYNLVHNAIKFTPENGKITVSTALKKDKALVSVEDNGIGISSEDIDLIWDRFYKSDKSRGRDRSGTGLGLAIVKNIVSEHGQEVWVESETGKGAKFTFTLDRVA